MANKESLIIKSTYLWDGVTERPEADLCLLVQHGKVRWKGTFGSCIELAPDAEVIDGDYLVMPSFTDAHDHGRGVSPTGFGVPDAPLEIWVQNLYKLPSTTHYTLCFYDGVRLSSSGVATVLHSHNPNRFEDLFHEVVSSANGYNDAGIRCILCPLFIDQNKGVYFDRDQFIHSLPKELGDTFRAGINDKVQNIDEYLDLITRLRETLKDRIDDGMVEIQLHPNGGQWCSDESLLKMKAYAMANNMRIHLHLLETKAQVCYAQKTWGKSFIEHYEEIGFLGPWLSLAHMIWLTDKDMELLAKYQVLSVNNPSSNIRLRSGIFPLRELQAKGAPLGLGLDGCAFDDDQDYLREMRTAFYNIKACGMKSVIDEMTPLKMATVWGSAISDKKLSPGTLIPGDDADIVVISMEEIRKPYADFSADPVDLLLHRGTRKAVDMTFVKGRKIYDKNDLGLYTKAEERLIHEIRELRDKNPCPHLLWKEEISAALEEFYKGWEMEYENLCR